MQRATKILVFFFSIFMVDALAQQPVLLGDVQIDDPKIRSAKTYNGAALRTIDILHTELEIDLDWQKHAVLGKANIYLKPYSKPIDTIFLDAQGFKIHQISMVVNGIKKPLQYNYNNKQLAIATGFAATRDTVLHLYIDYTALPDSLAVQGGAAIRDAKGFYFIPEQGKNIQQFWTQGEPESNSAWFPTVDKPNEKMTTRIGITVDSTWQTLSNGFLEYKTANGNGTRTDYWLMEKPHAPYLVMLAGGKFDTVGTSWQGKPVRYFVEPAWASAASRIFGDTPAMLTFFSEKLGVKFPWPKYDQIVVRDYVSGAMENTTATVFGDFMYTDQRDYNDETHEDVVAHELFHQWFGDLVTCESWAQLTLNEGFATYGEILWIAEKYGKDQADWHRNNDYKGYMAEYGRGKSVNMIRFDYDQPLDMFDRHSYAKGGLILHMLRNELGDAVFFAGLKLYLESNAYQTVEITDLRKSFESVSGRDLNWFFDQWYFYPGHPILKVGQSYNKEKGEATITISQLQDKTRSPIYRLPTVVAVFIDDEPTYYPIEINAEEQSFTFLAKSQPSLIQLDPENVLVAEIQNPETDAYNLGVLGKSTNVVARYRAAQYLLGTKNANLRSTVAGIAMNDDFWAVRELGLLSDDMWDENGKKKLKKSVEKLLKDPNFAVRAAAIDAWSVVFEPNDEPLFEKNLDAESYNVNAAALASMARSNPKRAQEIALQGLKTEGTWRDICIEIIAVYGDADALQQIQKEMEAAPDEARLQWYYMLYLSLQEASPSGKMAIDILADAAQNDASGALRVYAARFLNAFYEEFSGADVPAETAKKYKDLLDYVNKKLK